MNASFRSIRPLDRIVKRDGRLVPFDQDKIKTAVLKCLMHGLKQSEGDAVSVAEQVSRAVQCILKRSVDEITVEGVQRLVIQQLWALGYFEAAEHYTLYRERRRQEREEYPLAEDYIRAVADDAARFASPIQYYQFIGKFARWREQDRRRETWREACDRVMGWFKGLSRVRLTDAEWAELDSSLHNMETSCAMRVVQMAGPALQRCHVAVYNCAYTPLLDLRSFAELLYVLMSGSGCGFSVEDRYISQLPRVKLQVTGTQRETYRVEDSTEGWCDAYLYGLERWFSGHDVWFDVSAIRPRGARLMTKGGRASGPEPFLELVSFARKLILSRQGRVLTDLDCHDLACMTGRIVQVGGVRRAATISFSDLHSLSMRDAKSGNWYDRHKYRTMANNSAVYFERPDIDVFLSEFSALVRSRSGERGIANIKSVLDNLPRRRSKCDDIRGNPCLTGDVLVAVADGRGAVRIADLADEGRDVPVYCVDGDNVLTVRMMRHPRVTRAGVPVLKVALDNGGTIRVTENHRFRLRSGEHRKAVDLKPGDSLAVLTQYKPESCTGDSYADRYESFCYQKNQRCYPHRLIAEWHSGREVLPSEHVHHVNEDRSDNRPDNLRIVSVEDHLSGHSDGHGNPNYGGVSNGELLEFGRRLARSLGRRFSVVDWDAFARDNGLPRSFSPWRRRSLGDILAFAKRCAALEGVDGVEADPRVVRTYQAALKAGLNAEVLDGGVIVHKTCEYCGDSFTVPHRRREQGYCSVSCGGKAQSPGSRAKWKESQRRAFDSRKARRRDQQAEVYRSLFDRLGRAPFKWEWANACRLAGVSVEISRPSSPFPSWADLMEAARVYNHRVVSVERDGNEDVYNGTVDDFHNFFVGGWDDGLTDGGRRRVSWVNNLQCGEIQLRPRQFCNLSIAIARPEDTRESLRRKVRLAAYWGCMQKTATDFRYLRPEWKANCEEEALLGVDITGHADCPLLRPGASGRAELLRELRDLVAEVDAELSGRFGVNRSAADTCVKPGGDSAVFFNCASGVSPWFAEYIMRWVREPAASPVAKLLVSEGVPHAVAPEDPSLMVFGFPRKAPSGAPTRRDLTAVQQLENWLEWKLNWAEHSVSATIYVDEHEWPAVLAWVYEHFDQISGLSFLPRDNGIYTYAPNEELTQAQYEDVLSAFPNIRWEKLSRFEDSDLTNHALAPACAGGACEL